MLSTKELIKILEDSDLNSTEKELLEINIGFLGHKRHIMKKVGVEGIRGLATMVSYRKGLMKLFDQ